MLSVLAVSGVFRAWPAYWRAVGNIYKRKGKFALRVRNTGLCAEETGAATFFRNFYGPEVILWDYDLRKEARI